MTENRQAFSTDEFRSRVRQIHKEEEREGIDLLLIHLPENIYYLTGYQTSGYFACQAAVLARGVESNVTPDMLTVLGESPSNPGLFHTVGFPGHGVRLGLGVGSGLSQLIADGKTDLPIHAFHIRDSRGENRRTLRSGRASNFTIRARLPLSRRA